MSTLINEIDARTRLAGANQMELLLFHLGTPELFGINVFKVREVMKLPQLTRVPEADSRVVGMANIRGTMVPVIALKRSLGLGEHEVDLAHPDAKDNGILIITEYNASLQAFHVAAVDRIIRTSWSDIKTPPTLVRENNKGAVTAVSMLDDGRMVLILDVEKLLTDICPRPDEEVYAGVTAKPALQSKCVLFADDSTVARTQIRKALEKLGLRQAFLRRLAGQLLQVIPGLLAGGRLDVRPWRSWACRTSRRPPAKRPGITCNNWPASRRRKAWRRSSASTWC
jgi:two-component system, chemotaxis family, chemotaxis protein CheV